ncbi:hypothetical protein SDC9_192130 [bioreactor metagenome]|uniref:Uncharacterized protein n=1 Tax=bioreactor metagenome TaxID=1076179 RepID=A0A645HZU1_9ZZZZ
MTDKPNFNINTELLSRQSQESVSGQITRALKQANENLSDFILYEKAVLSQHMPSSDLPSASDMILDGKTRYNLSIQSGGMNLFISKGTPAKLSRSKLTVGTITAELNDGVAFQWTLKRNNFNTDELCILMRICEVC